MVTQTKNNGIYHAMKSHECHALARGDSISTNALGGSISKNALRSNICMDFRLTIIPRACVGPQHMLKLC